MNEDFNAGYKARRLETKLRNSARMQVILGVLRMASPFLLILIVYVIRRLL